MHARLPLLTVLLGLLLPGPCAAQSAAQTAPSLDSNLTAQSPPSRSVPLQALSANTLSVWAGGSFATGRIIGKVPRAQIGLVGLRYQRLLAPSPSRSRAGSLALTYTADVFPVLFLSIPPNTVFFPPGPDGSDPEKSSLFQDGMDTYAFGVSPVGLRLTSRVTKRVQPFLAGSMGSVYFAQSVPGEGGKHLNFTVDVGVGVQIVVSPDLILTAGYRYYHLSNGFRGQINPGLDANLLHLGVTVSQ